MTNDKTLESIEYSENEFGYIAQQNIQRNAFLGPTESGLKLLLLWYTVSSVKVPLSGWTREICTDVMLNFERKPIFVVQKYSTASCIGYICEICYYQIQPDSTQLYESRIRYHDSIILPPALQS